MSDQDSKLPGWAFPAVSWVLGVYFLVGHMWSAGWPPSSAPAAGDALVLGVALLLIFLPFFKRIKIGKWLELEREVEKTKSELREFKTDVQTNLALITTSVNSISNANTINVNMPGAADAAQARVDLDTQVTEETQQEARTIRDELAIDGEDTAMALARTRMRLEYHLKRIVEANSEILGLTTEEIRRMPLRKLFASAVQACPEVANYYSSFTYVTRVSNAAIHTQTVPASQAEEAVFMGAEIIALLSRLSGADPAD